MHKDIQSICFVACLTGLLPVCNAQTQFTLPRAIDIAIVENQRLGLELINVKNRNLGTQLEESSFEPSVIPEVSYNLSDEDDFSRVGAIITRKLIHGTNLLANMSSNVVSPGDTGNENLVLEIRQPLFRNYGRLIHEEPLIQAQSDLLAARRNYEQLKMDIILDVVVLYEEILRLEEQVKFDKRALQRIESIYRQTRAKEKMGRATRIDTLRVELQKGQALSRLTNNQERLALDRQEFLEILGMDIETSFTLVPTQVLPIRLPDKKIAMQQALENRLDYAQLIQDYEDAGRGVAIANRQLLPNFDLVARYQYRQLSLDNDGRNHWFLGFQTNTDLNRGSEKIRIQQAIVEQSGFRQIIEIFKTSLAREVQDKMIRFRRSRLELKILEQNQKHAQARLELSRRLFNLGRSDNFTVTDAEDAFQLAQSEVLRGKSESSIAAYDFLKSIGTLTEVPQYLKPRDYP